MKQKGPNIPNAFELEKIDISLDKIPKYVALPLKIYIEKLCFRSLKSEPFTVRVLNRDNTLPVDGLDFFRLHLILLTSTPLLFASYIILPS